MIKQIKQAYAFIKKWFWALPMWKRTILTSFIGAFAGSSVIGFLNKYALYYHALKQGFRIPVEGVEYLDLAVSLISFVIILISIIGTIIIYTIVDGIHKVFFKRISDRRKRLKSMPLDPDFNVYIYTWKSMYPLFLLFIFFFGIMLYLVFRFKIKMGTPFFPFYSIIIYFFSLTLLFFLVTMLISKEIVVSDSSRKLFTLTLITFSIVVISLSLFSQKLYSNFLATIHYGGRIPVVIEYRKADNTAASARGELLIRTSHSITILNTDTCAHEEIPAERVSKIGFIKE